MTGNKPHHIGTISPEMALLGLLYGSSGHGYDMHRKVITDLGQVWHLSQSQAYAILKRLEAQGDISAEEIHQEKLPSRQLLHITPKGCERFLDWLNTPSGGSIRAIRLEFVTRLYFIRQYMPEKLAQVFDLQRVEAEGHIRRLEKIRAGLPGDQIYNYLSLKLRLKQFKTVLEWLDDCQKLLQQKSPC